MTNSLPLIVLDWDGVVFDTHQYVETIFKELEYASRLSRTEIVSLYKASKDRNGYSEQGLAAAVAAAADMDAGEVLQVIQNVTRRTAVFLYPDAVTFIDQAKAYDAELMILTAGDEDLQAQKVAHSKQRHHFRDVHIVSAADTAPNKAAVLARLAAEYNRVLFFDDKVETISHIRKVFPSPSKVAAVWVHREDALSRQEGTGLTTQQLTFEMVGDYAKGGSA